MAVLPVAYSPSKKAEWDDFVAKAKNGVFLFYRDYMDYHADRFPDASLMLYEGDRLVALLPASGGCSHPGLTFGGFVTGDGMRQRLMLDCFECLPRPFTYKPSPFIYHRSAAGEDLYALFRLGAALTRRCPSTAIPAHGGRLSENRKRQVRKAFDKGVVVERSYDYERFMPVVEQALVRHGVKPVHTAAELSMLGFLFPGNIRLWTAEHGGDVLAGVVVYESEQVAHLQYIAATEEGKKVGALDAVIWHLVARFQPKPWLDFGISTDHTGALLNEGLIRNKEGYGGRTVCYDTYQLA